MAWTPPALVNTARYWLPLACLVDDTVRVSVVAAAMLPQPLPPLVDTCHWTEGAGRDVADALNVAGVPAVTTSLAGLAVTVGGTLTVRTADAVVVEPLALVNTAR